MEHGERVNKKQGINLYWCNKCIHLHEPYYGSRECGIVYGKDQTTETVYKDENGNYRCRHYKGRW